MSQGKSFNIWPYLIVVLLVLFAVQTIWSFKRASSGVSDVTNEKYYSHGLRYNETLIEKEAAEAQGWTMTSHLAGRRLQTTITDKEGQPVTDLQCQIEVFSDKTQPIRQKMKPQGPGIYVFELPADLKGQFTIRLQANREGAGLSRTLLVNL